MRANITAAISSGRASQTQVGGNTVAANRNAPASPANQILFGHMPMIHPLT
jgi:hypothetical protein